MIPNNACHLRLTAAAGTKLAVASSGIPQRHGVLTHFAWWSLTVVYTPRGLFPHAASLRQAFAHCGIFVTAASRRSLGSVSVPMRRANLSVPVPVVALVSRYLANKLIGHGPLPRQQVPEGIPVFDRCTLWCRGLTGYYPRFPAAIPKHRVRCPRIPRPSATLPAPRRELSRSTCMF